MATQNAQSQKELEYYYSIKRRSQLINRVTALRQEIIISKRAINRTPFTHQQTLQDCLDTIDVCLQIMQNNCTVNYPKEYL